MVVGVRSRASRVRSAAFGYANIVPFVAFALFPFYYMLITSLKKDSELYNLASVPFLIQTGVITDHYRYLFFKTEFWTWMQNSLIISVTATAFSLVIAILAFVWLMPPDWLGDPTASGPGLVGILAAYF